MVTWWVFIYNVPVKLFLILILQIVRKKIVFVSDQEFPSVSKMDIGLYFCEAVNSEGTERGDTVQMDVRKLHKIHKIIFQNTFL